MPRLESVPWVPRGLNRDEAAYYIGVGTTKFDEMVRDGRMPRGKRVDGRVIWDRVQLDLHFSELDNRPRNVIDEALQGGRAAR
ncbi:hypothetical protein [Xanthobacter autotrophicus]|uniref:hypothetical protein n=1 Tax=Xanthobacter autotrophicus TaxID=280 RepID=UPI003727421C